MASYRYATKVDDDKQAKAVALDQPVSTKQSIEVANWLRGRRVVVARAMLERVVEKKQAVPYRRFNNDVGHKAGIGPGRYPVKTSMLFLKLLKQAEHNAINKGLDEETLKIASIVVHKAAENMRHGRQRGRSFKNSHI